MSMISRLSAFKFRFRVVGYCATFFSFMFAFPVSAAPGVDREQLASSGISMEAFVDSLSDGQLNRFESQGDLACEDGVVPRVPKWNQYQKDEFSGHAGEFGRAKGFAPFIWIGKDPANNPVISLTSLVRVDWVYCDDDGNTSERSSGFSFRSVYDVSGEIGSPVIPLRHYVENQSGQSAAYVYPLYGGSVFADLTDFDPYATGVIDGPSDEPVIFDTPERLNIAFEPEQGGFRVVFKDACGPGKHLPLSYHRSDCGGPDQGWCNEMP